MIKKQVILSGMRPTGRLHLGNYFGALENWVRLQEQFKCYYFIADWHALTTGYEDTSELKSSISEVIIDYLAAGIDPAKSVIFIQSAIPEHAELYLLLSMITPLPWLFRCPTYKEQIAQNKDKNIMTYGFLGYPCLQAADILMYKADFVPVGEDQLPHLEITREIARRFNFMYGNVFTEPMPKLTAAKVLPGIDGRKMSKSYGNAVTMADSPEIIRKKVEMMVTDPARIRRNDPGHPEVCTVFAFHKVFSPEETDDLGENCRQGKIGCVQCKKKLAGSVCDYMGPIYNKRQEVAARPDYIRDVINEGNKKAAETAAETMDEVRKAIRIDWQ
jgi:tryptophanyl-tRNA synthetase